MTDRGWDVVAYEPAKLAELLCDAATSTSGARPRLHDICRKLHVTYLNEYLPTTGVVTIVVEGTYVDRDFLEDYAAYYARCFRDYPRFCSRLHFFSERFDASRFESVLQGKTKPDFLQNSYQGFVVIKPLPETIVGRTCLSVYPDEHRRHYPVARDCKAQLFGIDLKVKSLPFQEQDTAVARCATSALWSVFHATSDVFHHAVPTPVSTSWSAPSRQDEIGSARAVANQLVIPLYHKIRVQFREVLTVVDAFDQQLESIRESGFLNSLSGQLEWDIFLSEVAEFRRDVSAENLPADYRADLLVEPMPRFVWRAIGHVGAARVLEVVFDATDLEQGSFLCRCVEYQARLGQALSSFAPTQLAKLHETDPSASIFEWFADQR